jgi:type I restriction enzyme, S subunit
VKDQAERPSGSDWQVHPLGSLCRVIAGQSPKSSAYNDRGEGLPFFQGKKEFTDRYLAAPTTWTTQVTKKAEPHDILMSVRAPVGPINETLEAICIGRGLAAIRAGKRIDRSFLWYALLWLQPTISGNAGAVFPSINKEAIEALRIPLPPLEEQKRIVAVLDQAFAALDRARSLAEANLADAETLFQAQRTGLFAKVAEDAPTVELGSISTRVSVGHVGETSKHYVEMGGIPFVRSQNVRPSGLDMDGAKQITADFHAKLKKSQLVGGELLFVRVGANRSDCCSVPIGCGEMNCANIVLARPREGRLSYLENFCQSTRGRDLLLAMTTGSAQGVINTKSVAKLPIPFPDLDTQDRIVEIIAELRAARDRLCEIYRNQAADALDLQKSLLQQAFAGRLT